MRAQRFYVFEFVVRGRGDFPIDMLRYDSCVPKSQDDVRLMVDRLTERDIRLRMFSATKDGPTHERWASFGWPIVPLHVRLLRGAS